MMKTKFKAGVLCAAVCLAALSQAAEALTVDTLTNGSATINYNQTAWNGLASGFGVPAPVLTLNVFLDKSELDGLTYSQTLSATQTNPSYTNEVYPMNGPTVSNLSGRTNQPTTFQFTSGNAAGGTGQIGLDGMTVFAVSASLGGGVLEYGDFTLGYSASEKAAPFDGSGWYLKGNVAPAGIEFDLINPVVTDTGSNLTISGDLGVSWLVANELYATPSDQGTDVGGFTFTADETATPEPGSFTLGMLGGGALLLMRRRAACSA